MYGSAPTVVRGQTPMPFSADQLRYFVAVADEGQITRAAAKLHIAQPALSQAIAKLESHLGLKLLERHARGVTLTPAGVVFLEKARQTVIAEEDARRVAQALARPAQGVVEFGYLGVPPGVTNPSLVEAFKDAHPDVELRSRELTFPSLPTADWLAEVDVAICSRPAADPHVWVLPVSREPRVVVVSTRHPLAGRSELTVAEVLDETFIGFDPSVDPVWAGFWSLDDHRGGPCPHLTVEGAVNAKERFAMIAAGGAIAVVPGIHAAVMARVLRGVVAIPLRDADPAILSLVGREDRPNPLVEALRAIARKQAEDVDAPSAR